MTAKMGDRDSKEEIMKAFRWGPPARFAPPPAAAPDVAASCQRRALELRARPASPPPASPHAPPPSPRRLFDDDSSGTITFKDLKRVAKELGENLTDEELQEMIDEADRDGDGEVNEEEFYRIMKKTSLF
jgi:hypothetical protein